MLSFFRQLVRNFSGNRMIAPLFRGIVYKIYDFSQETDNPQKWLAEVFLKGAKLIPIFQQFLTKKSRIF